MNNSRRLKDFDLFNLQKQGVKRGSDCSDYTREGKQSFKPNGNTRTKNKLHKQATNTMRMEIQQLLETSRRFSNSSPVEMEKE